MTKELYNKLMAFGNDCEPFLTHNYMRTTDLDDGTATVTLPMHTESLNRWGGAHGGILFSLCDVAMGMAIMARACAAKGLCSPACRDRLLRTLTAWKLPTKTAFAPETLFQHLLSDKKRRGQKLTLVVLRETGRAELMPVSLEEALDFLKTGWEA